MDIVPAADEMEVVKIEDVVKEQKQHAKPEELKTDAEEV